MSLSPSDIKLLKMNQYKELATAVGVAYYGSKTDIANRIQSKLNGKAKLMTLIDKTKKTVVLRSRTTPMSMPPTPWARPR